jgi:ankyrin repeat protein
VAKRYGHSDILQILFDRTPAAARVVEACWIEDEAAVARFREGKTDVNSELDDSEQTLIAHAARNNKTAAVRLMLECGLPVGTPGQHRGTPLHWAAFHGNADMVRDILRFKPALDDTANDFNGTPVGWAIHGSEHGWYARTGDYPRVVELLLAAGAKRPSAIAGTAAVREVLQRL